MATKSSPRSLETALIDSINTQEAYFRHCDDCRVCREGEACRKGRRLMLASVKSHEAALSLLEKKKENPYGNELRAGRALH